MAVVWNDETIFKLIDIFETKRVLWDVSTKDYKDKIKKNDAWEDISKALDVPHKDVENKMHILRSQFAREKKKILSSKTRAGGADSEKCTWKFYDALKFLLNVTTSGGGSVTLKSLNKTGNHEDLPKAETSRTLTPQTPASSQPRELPPNNQNNQTQKTAKRKTRDNPKEIFQIVKSAKPKMDEFDYYGQYVAAELRATRNDDAVLQAKSYINNILIDMRMGKYNYGDQDHPSREITSKPGITAAQFENIEDDSQFKQETGAQFGMQ